MRLTLRTLLAYLDNILESEDYEALRQKIEESEFAKSLVARSESVTHQPTLGAPKLLGSGVARNANSVAEYLDNTMAPEQIQEFEKICLESDIHLAEVTSLHHVLTKAMGEAANVDPISRERMYQLIHPPTEDTPAATVEAPPQQTSAPATHETVAPSTVVPQEGGGASIATQDERPMPAAPPAVAASTVPKRSSSRIWPIAITALIAALITAAFFAVIDEEFRAIVLGRSAVVPADADNTAPDETPTTVPPTMVPPTMVPPSIDTPTSNAPTTDVPVEPLPEGGGESESSAPSAPTEPAVTDGIVVPGRPAEPTPTEPTPAETTPPPSGSTVIDGGDATATPMRADPSTEVPDAGENELALVDRPTETGPGSDVTEDPPVAAPAVMGRLLSQDQVLLATATTLDQLKRLAARDPLNAGDRLVVLPAFRPMISVGAMTVELDGETMIELLGIDDEGVPEVEVHFGRMVVRSLSGPKARLRLRLGEHVGEVSFDKADAAFGVEVRPFRTAGTDPEKVPSTRAVDLYPVGNSVVWTTANGAETLIDASRRILTPFPNGAKGTTDTPPWLTTSEVSPLDKRAVPWIEESIKPNRSVKLSLTELAVHKRTEIRRLAIRCCAPIGFFDPLLNALKDPESRPRWNLYVPELTQAVARDMATAQALRESLERLRGDAGFDLYRMLWGYSKTGLTKGGEAQQLVEYLDHDNLDFRVLSFWNLQQITGLGMSYHPEYTKVKRRKAIDRWRSKAEKGHIVPTTAKPLAAGKP